MTAGLPENLKLQITLENNRNDRVSQTKLLSMEEMILKLTDWVILFIRYDTRCYFNVRSKADISQLNLPHGTDN